MEERAGVRCESIIASASPAGNPGPSASGLNWPGLDTLTLRRNMTCVPRTCKVSGQGCSALVANPEEAEARMGRTSNELNDGVEA